MKKTEALEIAPKVSKVVMEYIEQILTDPQNKGEGTIRFISEKVEGKKEDMCVIAISVPDTGYKTRIDSGITAQQKDYFLEQVLNDLLDCFLEADTLGVGLFYKIRGMMGPNFFGVTAFSASGSSLKIDFGYTSRYLDAVIAEYNQRIECYKKSEEAKMYKGESSLPKIR